MRLWTIFWSKIITSASDGGGAFYAPRLRLSLQTPASDRVKTFQIPYVSTLNPQCPRFPEIIHCKRTFWTSFCTHSAQNKEPPELWNLQVVQKLAGAGAIFEQGAAARNSKMVHVWKSVFNAKVTKYKKIGINVT